MARGITPKDGADAVAMLDSEKPPRKRTPKKTPPKASKVQRVRTLLDQGKTLLEISKALDDVSWAYVRDVAAAWEKKIGKTVIATDSNGGQR